MRVCFLGVRRIGLLFSSSSFSFLLLLSSPLLISIGGVGSLVNSFPFLFAVGLFIVNLNLGVTFFLGIVRIKITFYLTFFEGLTIVSSGLTAAAGYLAFYLTFLEGLIIVNSGLAGYLTFLKRLTIVLKIFTSYKVRFFLRGRIEARYRAVNRFLLGTI